MHRYRLQHTPLNTETQGLPDAWSKLLTKSAITREDYAKDPQAVLDVLEFYTDHQKREMEEFSLSTTTRQNSMATTSSTLVGSNYSTSTLTPYGDNVSAPRYAGIGLGGSGAGGKTSLDRSQMKRQDSAPTALNGVDGPNGSLLSSSAGLARAAEIVNGAHAQYASTMSASAQNSQMRPGIPPMGASGALQASRPAPPRPLLTANRPAPPAPMGGGKPPLPDHTPTSADLRARAKAHGPPAETQNVKPPGLNGDGTPTRKESLATEKRPNMAPSKSSPATGLPATHPAHGAAGSTVGPPPVKPLQPKKPAPQTALPLAPEVTITEDKDGGVAAAAAALEKPKVQEKRISTMNEAQIMDKLRSVVSDDDPKQLYSKIRKVGQG